MADEDDINRALAFLRKHDASKTGAPVADIANFDVEDPDALTSVENLAELKKVGHEPVGPNWKKPGSFALLPDIGKGHPDSAWLIHERQDASGRYKAWLFFSTRTGQYYRLNDLSNANSGYTLMATPHDPWASPLMVRVGNASLPPKSGKKLDFAVLLPDLQKTGFLLKQPLEFLDKPASLFVLCAGLRNSSAASEFCAKRFHTLLLPKLSSKPTVWYDYELAEIVVDSVKALDKALLESSSCFSGCSFAVALLLGRRLVVASLGSVRCLLCRPAPVASTKAAAAAPARWTARVIHAGDAHTLADQRERSRVVSAGARARGDQIHLGSARPMALAVAEDDWEREYIRVTCAMNSFAVLALTAADIKKGSASIRKTFRQRSLIIHPDKVTDERRQQTTAIFAKMESGAEAVEAMLQADMSATVKLCEIHNADDEGRLGADPAVAAKLLSVEEGCGDKRAREAAKKFHEPLSKLQNVARQDVERAMQILETAVETVVRGTVLWTPPEVDVGVRVTRCLGCKDLKAPVKVINADIKVEVIQLGLKEPAALALLTDGMESVTHEAVAARLAEHAPGRPRAAALRLALDSGQQGEAASVVCAYVSNPEMPINGSGMPPAKRLKTGRPDRVRVSHVLLRWAGLKGEDEFARPDFPAPTRSQADAERELLELTETLVAHKDQRTLGARFKAEVLKRSECSTALNVPHADLGWVEPGGAEPPLELAAFDTPVGGISDVVLTTRGAHLMYRLA